MVVPLIRHNNEKKRRSTASFTVELRFFNDFFLFFFLCLYCSASNERISLETDMHSNYCISKYIT